MTRAGRAWPCWNRVPAPDRYHKDGRSVADFLGAGAQIIVGIGPVRIAGLRPPILVPVARIAGVGIRKREIPLGLRVVGGLVRQINLLAMLLLHLLINVRHVQGLLLIGRWWREKHKEVVAFLGLRLRR